MNQQTPKVAFLNFFRGFLKKPGIERQLAKLIRKDNQASLVISKLVPNHYQYAKKTFRSTAVGSVKMNLDVSDYMGHEAYFGYHESETRRLLGLAETNNTVFDIGANIGFTCLRLKEKVGTGGQVYAFEPDMYNFEQLSKNMNLNPELPITIFNFGMGQTKERHKLTFDTADNRGGGRINDQTDGSFNWIEVTTLDLFVEEQNIPKIDLIKIDVEGFEYQVLLGGKEIIQKWRPTLFIELSDANLQRQHASASMLITFLEEYYPVIIHAFTGERIHRNSDFKNCHFDIIARQAEH